MNEKEISMYAHNNFCMLGRIQDQIKHAKKIDLNFFSMTNYSPKWHFLLKSESACQFKNKILGIQKMLKTKAEFFHDLHRQRDKLLILPNAWDALSAKLFEQAGAQAIATTSAGMSAALGFSDGQKVPKNLYLSVAERIIKSVNIPVTVDIESGWGNDSSDIYDTVQRIIDMGGVGINIEDSIPEYPDELVDISAQCRKISAIREFSEKHNYSLFINARTDAYWLKSIPVEQRYEICLHRLLSYQDCGANGLFIPGLRDLSEIAQLTQMINLPVNILGGSWIKSISDLVRSGVSRVSVGSAPCRAVTAFIQDMARKLIQRSDFSIFDDAPSYEWLNGLFENL